jgi:hypothetical protein
MKQPSVETREQEQKLAEARNMYEYQRNIDLTKASSEHYQKYGKGLVEK